MIRIKVNSLSKKFLIDTKRGNTFLSKSARFLCGKGQKKELWALKNISFEILAGEGLMIIGKNGAGKTTLLRILAGIYEQTSGTIKKNGKTVPMINFQYGLKDRLSVRDNIFLCNALLGIPANITRKNLDKILFYAELPEYADTKLYQLSSGMIVKLMFVILHYYNPEIILWDEFFTNLDKDFRKKALRMAIDTRQRNDASWIVATHDFTFPKPDEQWPYKVLLLHEGSMVMYGDVEAVMKYYHTMSPA